MTWLVSTSLRLRVLVLALSVVLMVDTSGSTAKELKYEADSASRFFRALLGEGNLEDTAALYTFNWEVREQQPRGVRVLSTVLQHDAHAGRIAPAGTLELAAFHRPAQAQHLGRGLREIHVDRVDLLHQGQRSGLALAYQGLEAEETTQETLRRIRMSRQRLKERLEALLEWAARRGG